MNSTRPESDASIRPSLSSASHHGHVLWKASIATTVVVLIVLTWQCGSVLRQGRLLAEPAVQEFHKKLNTAQYDEIYSDADESLAGPERHKELVTFLQGVHHKLGDVRASNQTGVRVNATTFGSSVVAQYETRFERGSATETFTWVKKKGALKLSGYDIRSNALVEN